MKRVIKYITILALVLLSSYFIFGYINSYFGWYGYEKWKHRKASQDIMESKKRGVFVKELNFRVEGYLGDINGFRPFIERGFKWGHHTSEETVALTNSNYPYQICFDYKNHQELGIYIAKEDLVKFDSSNSVWGYLKKPKLNDTIRVEIRADNIGPSALIKVW